MHAKSQADRGFAEVTLRLSDADVGERLLQDIAAYNALVEMTGRLDAPASRWLRHAA